MRNSPWVRFALPILVVHALGAVTIQAQPGRGPGQGGGRGPRYDTATVQTVTGTIERVDTVRAGPAAGVHLQLRTGSGIVPVHLGPAWYLDDKPFRLRAGERVTVRGSRITYDQAPALIAAELRRGEAVLPLRDARGYPLWGGSPTRTGRRTPRP